MRPVAIALVALLLLLPSLASAGRLNSNDECDDSVTPTSAGNSCIRVALTSVPAAVTGPTTGPHVFLWLGAVDCASGPVCAGLERPPTENRFTGTPGVYGLLYADSNGFPGLQRGPRTIGGTFHFADELILV